MEVPVVRVDTGGLGGSTGGLGGSGGLANLLSGIDQNTLNTVAAQLGVSGDQLNNLRNQVPTAL